MNRVTLNTGGNMNLTQRATTPDERVELAILRALDDMLIATPGGMFKLHPMRARSLGDAAHRLMQVVKRANIPSHDLPDHDDIRSLRKTPGMYRRDRWPADIQGQMLFLRQVEAKWGSKAEVHIADEFDGYPAYVQVKA